MDVCGRFLKSPLLRRNVTCRTSVHRGSTNIRGKCHISNSAKLNFSFVHFQMWSVSTALHVLEVSSINYVTPLSKVGKCNFDLCNYNDNACLNILCIVALIIFHTIGKVGGSWPRNIHLSVWDIIKDRKCLIENVSNHGWLVLNSSFNYVQ